MRTFTKVKLTKKASKRMETMHSYVYDNEVDKILGEYKNGDLVDIVNYKDKYIGTGFINDNSKIIVRVLSRNTNDTFDRDFYKRRIKYAIDYRKTVMPSLDNVRLVFGDSDFLPGLTIDKYNNILVSEISTMGIELIKDLIYEVLIEVLNEENIKIDGIYERSDSSLRDKEGLPKITGFYEKFGKPDYSETIIIENDIKYIVDFTDGQKTGFFLDQKYNRLAVRDISKNKKVLDVCTCTGSFGFNAYKGGAKKVVSVDISKKSLEVAKRNCVLNDFDIEYIESDAFTYLENLKKGEFDFIILDPPAFTKSRKTVNNASLGYEELNYLAMKKLNRGGYLATCSCSHFMTDDLFLKNIEKAALKAGVMLRIVDSRRNSKDHPILLNVPETSYLKFYIFEIV